MTDFRQIHNPSRLYGANHGGRGRTAFDIKPSAGASNTEAFEGFEPAKTPSKKRFRSSIMLGVASSLFIVVAITGFSSPGIRMLHAAAAGDRFASVIRLIRRSDPVQFEAVQASVETTTDGEVLMIEGAMRNQLDASTEAPGLRISVRGSDQQELYGWVTRPPKSILKAKERAIFRTRLESPPANGVTVWVRAARPDESSAHKKDGA